MSDFATALHATWPVFAFIAVLCAFAWLVVALWDMRLKCNAERDRAERYAKQAAELRQQAAEAEQRRAAQWPRDRGQDVADPDGNSVFDARHAVGFEVERGQR